MKIILIGRGEIFYKIFLKLYNKKYLYLVIFDNKNNKQKPSFYNLIRKKNCNYIVCNDINKPAIIDRIAAKKFDYILSVNNYQIFGDIFLSRFKNKIINYHNSLIPNFKGLNSIPKAIISRQKYTGISWHLVKKKIDHGPVIFSKKIRILKNDTAANLTLRCNQICINYISNFLHILKKKNLKIKKHKIIKDFEISKKMLHLNSKLKFKYLDSIVRAFNFYPFKNNFGNPYVNLKKKKIFIRKIVFYSSNKSLCRRRSNSKNVLVKFADKYVVFKKLL
jgi:methionyl-tRNA formyltransferase